MKKKPFYEEFERTPNTGMMVLKYSQIKQVLKRRNSYMKENR